MSLVNPDAPLQDYQARHLLRRTGFGPMPKDFQNIQGGTRGNAADFVLDFRAKPFKPGGKDFERMHNKWFKFILKSKTPLLAKLALFWHDHFSVGFTKVQDVKQMAGYVQLLHTYANGNFKDFVKAMNKNPAMMEYLDTVRNDDDVPNENYARELQELFTLGVKDFGSPAQNNYTQADIVQIARAFTGWRYDDHGNAFLDDGNHDGGSPKIIYQSTGGFGAGGQDITDQGSGPGEIDRVIDIIFAHTDSTGKNTVARRTAYRLCEYFAHASPDVTQFVDDVVADSGFDTTLRHRRAAALDLLPRQLLPHRRGTGVLHGDWEEVGQVADRLRREHAAPAPDEAEGEILPDSRRELLVDPRPPDQHGPGDGRSAERVRLGLGGRLGEQRHAARALQLRPRPHVGA